MTTKVGRKWRPTLSMIVFVVLATVMALPLIGLFFFRLYENQLIRHTESELIAQTTVLAAVFAREVAVTPGARELARPLPRAGMASRAPVGDYHPIEPTLDLAGDDVLPRRPDARAAAAPPSAAFTAIGATLGPIVTATQDVTLAGFRLLDPDGVVIAGRDEIGRSLAHVEEVAIALGGRYGSALRVRLSNSPPPPVYSISRGTGIRVFVAMPVVIGNAVAGVVYASRTPSNIVKHLFGERRKVAMAAAAIVLVTALIGFLFSRTITRPIRDLAAQAQAIGRDGTAAARPRHYGTREIAGLSLSFVTMAERLSERAAYIDSFTAHVSHELKSPITSITGAAELLKDAATADAPMPQAQARRFLDNILDDTRRLTLLLDRLRELARADNPTRAGATTLAAAIGAIELAGACPALTIADEGDSDAWIAISQENAVIILSHLADNAARHGARTLRITARITRRHLAVVMADDGPGISDANRPHVFEPFFTTRRESGGTGMGLRIVRSMVESHGGSIELLPSDRGAAFALTLPLRMHDS